jgi:hypothetical protein
MKTLGKKQARIILRQLRTIQETSRMKSASLSLNDSMSGREEDTEKIRKATELWRQSWITSPLEGVIFQLEQIYGERV